ncbi:putative CCCH and RING finger protein [Aspergillus taichungensis]|uniref:Pre-mRNA-splicing factor CWC24 n=1 Tax=Aspergillus taichungensis TaxID=482145 RepID=A0A2J5HR84_9EURO|nr:putative CCCH and RING finger protein [Aspergillus taichungensis]
MADAPVTFKKRSAKAKATVRKKEAPPPASDSDSGFTSSDDDQGQRIKRRRKNAAVTASSTTAGATRPVEDAAPASVAPAPLQSTNDATKQSNWYDETELDAKNLLGTTRGSTTTTPSAPDGTYKGAANYQSFIQKNPDAPGKKFGPVKAPTNVRAVTFMDYMPNVCKDYKKTGFCGYGDSCIYAHMREDYKQGWELDQDWDKATDGDKKKVSGQVVSRRSGGGEATKGDEEEEDEALLESIPFACILCEKPYQYPITTKCGHYFCEACALKRYRKDPSCAACGASTGGVFNTAKKLNQLLERKRERARRRGGEGESEDEGSS